MHMWLLLTPRCNLVCGYCFQRKSGYHQKVEIPSDSLDRFFEFVETRNIDSMTIIGGEAFVSVKDLKRVLEFARRRHISISMITNGTIYLGWLKDFSDIISQIQISIDGPQRIHDRNRKYENGAGSYRTVIRNIQKYNSDGLHVSTHMVIPVEGYKESVDSIKELLSDVPEDVRLSFELEHGLAQDWKTLKSIAKYFYKTILDFPQRLRKRILVPRRAGAYGMSVCQAGVNSQTYDALTGNFFSCHESAGTQEDIVGDIRSDPIFDVKALERVVKNTDGTRYRLWNLPWFLSEILKYILPVSVCWKQFSDDCKDTYSITPYEMYLAWMQFVHHRKFGQEAEVV